MYRCNVHTVSHTPVRMVNMIVHATVYIHMHSYVTVHPYIQLYTAAAHTMYRCIQYIYMYIYVCVYIYIYIYIYICIYVCVRRSRVHRLS